jgi:hypothetical protein
MAAAGYHGTATVEFRCHSQSGRLVTLKFDPRINTQVAMSGPIGQDEARATTAVLTDDDLTPAPAFPGGVAWFWTGAFVWGMAIRRKRMPVFSQLSLVARWFRRIQDLGDASLNDPIPFLVTVRRGSKIFRKRIGSGRSPAH